MIQYDTFHTQITLDEALEQGFPISRKDIRVAKYLQRYEGAILAVSTIKEGFKDLVYWDGAQWVYLCTKKD